MCQSVRQHGAAGRPCRLMVEGNSPGRQILLKARVVAFLLGLRLLITTPSKGDNLSSVLARTDWKQS
jgi:hypothetical protein